MLLLLLPPGTGPRGSLPYGFARRLPSVPSPGAGGPLQANSATPSSEGPRRPRPRSRFPQRRAGLAAQVTVPHGKRSACPGLGRSPGAEQAFARSTRRSAVVSSPSPVRMAHQLQKLRPRGPRNPRRETPCVPPGRTGSSPGVFPWPGRRPRPPTGPRRYAGDQPGAERRRASARSRRGAHQLPSPG